MSVSISSCPVDALIGGGVLIVGCERDGEGDLRLYLHARYRNEFVTIPAGDEADAAERVWRGARGHLWMSGLDA